MRVSGACPTVDDYALSLHEPGYCLAGVTFGTPIGVLPGIGSLAATSLLLPVAFYLEPATALAMLAGVLYGAQYGGSIASILLNLAATASARCDRRRVARR